MEVLGSRSGMVSLVVVVVAVAAVVLGNGSGPKVVESADICGMSIDELLTCKPAVQAPDSVPPQDCCKALEKVKPPSCLCQYQSYLPAFGIDKNVALHLPQRCKLDNAKSFHC